MFNTGLPIKYYDVGSSTLSGAGTGATIGSIVPGVGTLVGGLIGGGIGLVSGLFGKKKANNILKNNPYPNMPVPEEALANQQMAQAAAQQGLPSQQYDQAMKNIQRGQSDAISRATDRRAGVGAIGAIQQQTNDAMGNLDAKNAAARIQNQRNLMTVNNQIGAYRNKAWEWNQGNKYEQDRAYGMGLLGQSNQNIIGGADRIASGLIGSGLLGGRRSKITDYSAV